MPNALWPDDPNAGDIIPLTRGEDGKLKFIWPNALREAVSAAHELVTAPGNALQGKYSKQELRELGPRMAMTMAGAGAGIPGEANAFKMFGGIKAKTANKTKLTQALTLEGRGAGAEHIWNETGWMRGPDKKWRFEIPDAGASLNPRNFARNGEWKNGQFIESPGGDIKLKSGTKLPDLLRHEKAYEAYPELQTIGLKPIKDRGAGAYYSTRKLIELGPNDYKGSLSNTLHEVQHGVQDIEGFAEGGSPEQFLSPDFWNRHFEVSEALDDMDARIAKMGADPKLVKAGLVRSNNKLPLGETEKHLQTVINSDPEFLPSYLENQYTMKLLNDQKSKAYHMYRKLAGEVEANTVQERHALGDYSTFPPAMPGYPPFAEQSVWLGGRETPQLSFKGYHGTPHTFEPVDHNPFGEFTDKAIGTGEGAQTYGHGHYVAGARETAEDYANKLGGNTGNLLHLKITPEEHELLDWDSPLSEMTPALQGILRPKIMERLNRQFDAIIKHNKQPKYGDPMRDVLSRDDLQAVADKLPGSEIYRRLGLPAFDEKEGQKNASKLLSELGVPGIRYLDQFSRTATNKEKTSNYVIFDPKHINIFGRNEDVRPSLALLPVEHDPWQHFAEPIPHDPFATLEKKP